MVMMLLTGNVAPACSISVSPHCALLNAVCKLDPAETWTTAPVEGVADIAVLKHDVGSAAGPSVAPPKFGAFPLAQYLLSGPVDVGGGVPDEGVGVGLGVGVGVGVGVGDVVAAVTVTAAVLFFEVSARLVAVTSVVILDVTLGAVRTPADVIVPALVDHLTPVLLVLRTVAKNVCCPPELTLALVGEIDMLTGEVVLLDKMFRVKIRSPRSARGLSVTKTAKVYDPAFVGVPEITPVEELNVSPGGRLPRMIENW
jgi:hypothetical protein